MNAFWNGSFGFSLLASVREDKTMDDKEGEVKDQVKATPVVDEARKTPSIVELQEKAGFLKLTVVTLIVLSATLSDGVSMSFSAPAAILFTAENATNLAAPLREDELSWFMSILTVGVMTGTLIGGAVADHFGRKMTMVMCQILAAIGWAILYLATEFHVLLIGRLILGLGNGIDTATVYVYLSEISLVKLRGGQVVVNTLLANAAFVYTIAFAAYLSYEWLLFVSCLPMIIFLLAAIYLPESPMWLLKKNRDKTAIQALAWIRGPGYEGLHLEIEEMKHCLKESGKGMSLREQIGFVKSPSVVKPMLLLGVLYALQSFSGSDTMSYYALDIFRRTGISMDNYILGILVQGGFTFGYVLSIPLLTHLPRRVQYCISGFTMAMCATGLAVGILRNDQVLMPTCAIVFAIGYGSGIGSVTYALLGEILPTNIKGICSSILLSIKYWMVFLNLKVFPSLAEYWGISGLFLFHACVMVVASLASLFVIPDTRGKTLTELANLYKK